MKTKQEIKNWILENCIDENGNINLEDLDFSDFYGIIFRGGWKVKGHLFQYENVVEGNLYQYGNKVGGTLFQFDNKVEGNLNQEDNKVQGDLIQRNNKVKGDLNQYGNKVKGGTYNDFDGHTEVMKFKNDYWITDFKPEPNYEDMSRGKLIEIIKELKEILND